MKHLIKTLVNAIIAAAALAAPTTAAAQAGTQPEPIVVDGCRPLLAPDCVVDDVVTEIAVGKGNADYSAVLDANIDNSATISSLINVGVASNPIISIRDVKHKYAGGQQVGFVIGSGSKLLDLSVIKNFTITLYNDNEMVYEPITVEGETFKLLSLDLLSGKGRNTMVVDVPKADKDGKTIVFDEIMLCANGVNLDAVSLGTEVYYGFVGNAEEQLKNPEGADGVFYKSEHSGPLEVIWTPDDLANAGGTVESYTILVNGGYTLGVEYVDGYAPDDVEVGFVYDGENVIEVGLLSNIKIKVSNIDENGKETHSKTYNVSSSLASVNVISSNDRASYSVRVSGLDFKWNRVELIRSGLEVGGSKTTYHYAYIKKFDIPKEAKKCDLGLSADELICNDEATYTLTSEKPVKWELVSGPGSVDITQSDEYATNATVSFKDGEEGVYTFKATDADGCTGEVRITRGKTGEMTDAMAGSFCGTPLDASLDGVDLTKESDGGLLVIDGLENADNIIDGDLNSYASYARGVQLAANTCIAGVKKRNGKFDKDEVKVVGFVAETPSGLLGADVLTFYRIVLYNEGKDVYSSVTDNNNAVSASLIGAPGGGMVRYAVTVPDGTEFDEFALFSSGVLNLDLQGKTMKIYNAFTSADPGCATAPAGSPLGRLGVTPINLDATGARINYSQTGGSKFDLVTAVSTTTGLGYLIANDVTALGDDPKGVVTNVVANVLAPSKLAVKTGRVFDKGRWVGLVMKVPAGLASIDVLDLGMKIGTYYKGSSTGDEAGTDVGLLRANLLGYGDYVYLSVYANHKFDEVRFEKGELASVLGTTEYLGFYTYADADGDGIPDEEDPDFCEEPIVVEIKPSLGTDINSLCEGRGGEGLKATVKAENTAGLTYNITDTDRKEIVASGTVGQSAEPINIDFDGMSLGYGRYELRVSDRVNPLTASAKAKFTIHAVQTQWAPQLVLKQDAQAEGGDASTAVAGEYEYSRDWNAWENWTQGVPVIGCTDVVIPGNAPSFPVLEEYAGTGDAPKDFNSCKGIHFMAGAEAQNTDYLDYDKVWVDLELSADRYYMLSAPLTDMVTGDFFVPAAMNGTQDNDLFTDLTPATSPENRFSPRVYQRLWLSSAPVNNGTTETASETYDETKWTPPFNALNQKYERGMGFSLKAAAEDLSVTKLKFRFPKTHEEYYYYNEKKQQTDIKETVDRGDGAGRLFGFGEDEDEMTVNLTTGEAGNVFLVGNPFMAHINIKKFLETNSDVTGVKVYDGNANNSAILCDGDLLTNADGWTGIAPMQSFFVTTKGDASMACDITFTRAMLEQQPGGGQPLRVSQCRAMETAADGGRLVIRAKAGGVESTALVRFSDGASAGFVPGEDASLLVDDEVRPRVQVFTLAGGRAADIQQTPDVDRLTLGLMTAAGAPLTLSLDGDTDWTLYDTQTGATYPMDGGAEVDLGPTGSSTGRYMLVRDASAIAGGLVPDGGVIINRTQQGTLTVTSADGTALKSCKVYSADGTLVDSADGEAPSLELRAARGVSIVAVAKADGTSYTQKIY